MLEALACGTPVIVTSHCHIAEVIDGRAGFVVPYDGEHLERVLLRMFGDDKMRQHFGEKGRLLVSEKFNWKKIAVQLENVYESCRSN